MRTGKARLSILLFLSFLLAPVTPFIPARAEQLVGWNLTTSYPFSVAGLSCVTYSGYIYCVGGGNADAGRIDDSVYYASLTSSGVGTWSKTTSYPIPIVGESCVASGGYIYCVGGQKTPRYSGLVNSVYYAPITSSGVGAWSNSTSYPILPPGPCDAYLGYIYCVGGNDMAFNPVSTVYFARLTSSGIEPWKNTTSYPIPTNFAHVTCTAASGYIYCVPGYKAPITSSGVGMWSSVGYPDQLGNPGSRCVTSIGYLYCMAGSVPGQVSVPIFYASLNYTDSGGWTRTLDYPGIGGMSCVTQNRYFYCVGGVAGTTTYVNSVYFTQIAPPPVPGFAMRSWHVDQGVRLTGPGIVGMPAGVQLPDGRIRLYFCQRSNLSTSNSPFYVIRSAISTDGLSFFQESGIRVNASGILGDPKFSVCNPTIVKLRDATYRVYYNGINSSVLRPSPGDKATWWLYTAKSTDGLLFTDDSLAVPNRVPIPTGRLLADGRIRIYAQGEPPGSNSTFLESWISNDGISFNVEDFVHFSENGGPVPPPPLLDLSSALLPDGKTMLILHPGPAEPRFPLGFYSSYSTDGLKDFSPPVEIFAAPPNVNLSALPQGLADPELIPLSDGSYRLYYDSAVGASQLGIYSAHWTPLLPQKTEMENVTITADTFPVIITHNCSLSSFAFDLRALSISFNLVGPVGYYGRAMVTFPNDLLSGAITITRNGSPIQAQKNSTGTRTTLVFTFEQSPYSFIQIFGTTSPTSTSTSTSITSTTPSSTTTASTSSATAASKASSTISSTSASTGGGSGIPEFPYQIVAAAVFTALIISSYLVARRHPLRGVRAGSRNHRLPSL